MKCILGIVCLFFVTVVAAQQISVQSFRKLENDLSARGSEGRTDQNGDRCAIIKVVTPETDFVFEPDALGTMGTGQKTGEIWLYVPYGVKRLTIKHPIDNRSYSRTPLKVPDLLIGNREVRGETVVTLGFNLPAKRQPAKNGLTINWSSSVTPSQKEILSRLVENMVKIEGSSFDMGGTSEQGSDAYDWEKPVHKVILSDYYIGKYEVRQCEWEAIMGSNPSDRKGNDLPVEGVNWEDCHAFIRKLNALTGLHFKLPTEAQWEYAARGGNLSCSYKYSGSNDLGEVGWYWENSGDQVLTGEWDVEKMDKNHCRMHPVGQKEPNELGLYDMSGNVWEWCEDWYEDYSSHSQTDPVGADSGSSWVIRGGCWCSEAKSCRVSHRHIGDPIGRNGCLGFRLGL